MVGCVEAWNPGNVCVVGQQRWLIGELPENYLEAFLKFKMVVWFTFFI